MMQSYKYSTKVSAKPLLNKPNGNLDTLTSNSIMTLQETKTHHRNSMILHEENIETETKCLRIVYADMKKGVARFA